MNLLDAMQRVTSASIIFSSTCATYGESVKIPISEDQSADQ